MRSADNCELGYPDLESQQSNRGRSDGIDGANELFSAQNLSRMYQKAPATFYVFPMSWEMFLTWSPILQTFFLSLLYMFWRNKLGCWSLKNILQASLNMQIRKDPTQTDQRI